MARLKAVEGGKRSQYWHVRTKDPPRPKRGRPVCRTPSWGQKVAGSVSKDAKIRTCLYVDGWLLQSILIKKKGHTKKDAVKLARKIKAKVEKRKKN